MTKSASTRESFFLLPLLTAVVGLTFAASAQAGPNLDQGLRTDLKRYGSESAACYVEENGAIQGVNPNQPVKIASVMKLLTTLWAIDVFGVNHEYVTKIYYQASNRELHIEGARDPFFDRDRVYLLLSDLNRSGINSLERLTIDRNVYLNMDLFEWNYGNSFSWMYTERHANNPMGSIDVAGKLNSAFNTASWYSGGRVDRYRAARQRNPTSNMVETPRMAAASVQLMPHNPLAGKPGVVVYEVRSRPLRHYLKKMNIHSLNAAADELFHSMGGEPAFRNYLQQRYAIASNDIHTGSGLPNTEAGRNDSSLSCATTVRLIRQLDHNLEAQGMDMSDVVMVAGVDAGATFNDGSRAFVVKTGTLNNVKNLAGAMNTTSGEVYFGIFLQSGGNANGIRNALSRFKSEFRSSPVRTNAYAWDPLDPKMALRPAAMPINIRR